MGLTVSEWREMTPQELSLAVEARNRREQDAQRARLAEDYALAGMIRLAVWAKRMPSFERLFPERKGGETKHSMTDEEMYAAVVALNRAMGGLEE